MTDNERFQMQRNFLREAKREKEIRLWLENFVLPVTRAWLATVAHKRARDGMIHHGGLMSGDLADLTEALRLEQSKRAT